MRQPDFIIFDVETTGKNPNDPETQIIEISAQKIDYAYRKISKFQALVKYEKKLPKEIVALTNITDKMLEEDGRDRFDVMSEFASFIDGCVLVAHNAEYDLSVTYRTFTELGIDFKEHEFYDTLAMSRNLVQWSKNHKLNTLCEEFAIALDGHHRSENDVEATAELFVLLHKMMTARRRDYLNLILYVKEKPLDSPITIANYEAYEVSKLEKVFF